MKRTALLPLLVSALLTTGAQAYDGDMAAKIAPVAAKLDHAGLVKGGCKVSAEDLLAMKAKKEKVTVLDVRTTAETRIVAMPGALHIPLDVLMRKENLDRLPTDGRIIVVCHSGNRAAAATALLSAVGFTNASYVNGGLIALTTATTPKAVPIE